MKTMQIETDNMLEKAREIISKSSNTVFFTGAGISTPSGIPDFRSPDSGLWGIYDPFEVASLSAFRQRPDLFFDWIKPLYTQSKNAQPNVAHHAIADAEKRNKVRSVITQNIDGLHQKAGSENVIELHGSVRTATCPFCQKQYDGELLLDIYINNETLPSCPDCNQVIKPDVILYEELLPLNAWYQAESEMRKADVIVVAGSSLETYPANSLPKIGISNGAALIIITLSSTPFDSLADVVIHEDVTQVIPFLFS
jgi:NAD-dependent deacetylase